MINNDLTNSCMFDYPDTSDLGQLPIDKLKTANKKQQDIGLESKKAEVAAQIELARQQGNTERVKLLTDLFNSLASGGFGMATRRQDVKIAESQARTAEAQARMAAGMTPSSSFNIKNLALPLLGLAAVGLVVFVAKKRS